MIQLTPFNLTALALLLLLSFFLQDALLPLTALFSHFVYLISAGPASLFFGEGNDFSKIMSGQLSTLAQGDGHLDWIFALLCASLYVVCFVALASWVSRKPVHRAIFRFFRFDHAERAFLIVPTVVIFVIMFLTPFGEHAFANLVRSIYSALVFGGLSFFSFGSEFLQYVTYGYNSHSIEDAWVNDST